MQTAGSHYLSSGTLTERLGLKEELLISEGVAVKQEGRLVSNRGACRLLLTMWKDVLLYMSIQRQNWFEDHKTTMMVSIVSVVTAFLMRMLKEIQLERKSDTCCIFKLDTLVHQQKNFLILILVNILCSRIIFSCNSV